MKLTIHALYQVKKELETCRDPQNKMYDERKCSQDQIERISEEILYYMIFNVI